MWTTRNLICKWKGEYFVFFVTFICQLTGNGKCCSPFDLTTAVAENKGHIKKIYLIFHLMLNKKLIQCYWVGIASSSQIFVSELCDWGTSRLKSLLINLLSGWVLWSELVHKAESGRPNDFKTGRPNLWRDGRIIKKLEGRIWP